MEATPLKQPVVMDDHQVPLIGRIGYCCSAVSTAFQIAIPTFLVFYGTQSLALSILSISLMMTLVKVLDGITDILAGFVVDKTKSKMGKARPWFLWMSLPYGLFFAMEFCIPASWGPGAKMFALALTYALTVSVFGTMLGIAGKALLSRITKSQKERNSLALVSSGIAGTLIGLLMAVVFPLTARFGYTKVFVIFGVISFVMCMLCFLFCREKDFEEYAGARSSQAVSLKELAYNLIHNKYALLVTIYILLNQMGGSILQGCGTYYATYVLGDQSWFTKFMLCGTLGSFVAAFVGIPIVRKIGHKKLFLLGGGMAVIAFLFVLLFGAKNPWVVMVAYFFGLAGSQTFTMSQIGPMCAAAVDYGEWKTKVRSEGVTGCLSNAGSKVGGALGTALMGVGLAAGGFVEGGGAQTAQAVSAINLTFAGLMPLIFLIQFIVVALTYKLEKQLPEIQLELANRRMSAHQG